MNETIKAFWEQHTNKLFKTLKIARTAHKTPYVYRVWLNSKLEIIGQEPVWGYGTQISTIKSADAIIAERLATQNRKGGEK